MSIRAYKIIEIKQKKEPTFNCWHDNFLFENGLIDEESGYNDNGGMITLNKDTIEQAIESGEYSGEELKTLKKILKDFKPDEDYQEYICY